MKNLKDMFKNQIAIKKALVFDESINIKVSRRHKKRMIDSCRKSVNRIISQLYFGKPVSSAIRAIQRRGRTARERSGSVHVLVANDTRDVHVLHASRNREKRMHNILTRMRLDIPIESFETRKDGKLLEFQVKEDGKVSSALQFLQDERLRLQSIEQEVEKEKPTSNDDSSMKPKQPKLHTRSRSQKSLFEFEDDSSDPWSPVLDGRDINRQ